jgi:MFS family permease
VLQTPGSAPPGARRRLGFAAAGVLLGAADTYVVVVALPAIMAAVGVDLAHLEEAAPIISGFLLGYVAVLPLLGRLSDLFGRGPVLALCLVAFAAGSLLTASANTLWVIVLGRTVQGAGGGGLVPVTLALVADLWPPRRRGVPLGVVGAVQEIGSVVGPLYGAALTTVSTWRAIFYINMPLAAAIAAGVRAPRRRLAASSGPAPSADVAGRVLAALCVAATVLAIASPPALSNSLTMGVAFAPLFGGAGVSSPIALVALVSAAAFVAREVLAGPARAVVPLRRVPGALRRVDWPGALLVALILGAVVIVFASADPASGVVGSAAPLLLPAAALLTVLLVARELRVDDPLIDLRALRDRAAVGSLLTSLAAGAALMAALVDVPIFARATVDPTSQVQAALVLARLLVAVPVGALLGGILADRAGFRAVAGAGLLVVTVSFALMAGWTPSTLADGFAATGWLHPSDPVLVAAGLGFGLAIVPVTAAILGAVSPALHGMAASLTVAARLVGMLAGLSLLTAVGLRRFYSVQAMLTPAARLCPDTPLRCPAYDALQTGAVVDELHVIFLGAGACALLGALFAVALLRRPRESPTPPLAIAA